ncbi:potassium channel family protein [Bacillus sp. EB600]|uniref:potassium channel family protein n=1 Tax=Bacillus sp. EB600 TaxID=2806345 RepID=UPI00210871C6|nr:potassium channel family protein [Bacillus sp. EB600]MCQ6281188.1 two pore domain potassium channel family protein [Bacillus sp. EB600]
MFYLLLLLVIFCIFMSLRTLFLPYKMKGKFVSLENFLSIGYVYATVVLGFGIIYMVFALNGRPLLIETGMVRNDNIFETCFYFSAMTLFSVGNGDVIPHGLGRIITVIEALIGYTLPAAFITRAVFDKDK